DPFRMVTNHPDSFNPFDSIPSDDPILIDACRDLAEALVIRTGQEKEPFWNDAAETFIRATSCFCARWGPPGDRSLQTVREIIGSPMLKQAIAALKVSTDFGGLLSRMGYQLECSEGKELASTLTTTLRFLGFLDSAALQASTESSSFDAT